MGIVIGNKVIVFGKESVRIFNANRWTVKAMDQDCDPIPLIDLCKRYHWWSEEKGVADTIAWNCVEAMLAAGYENTVIEMAKGNLPLQPTDLGRYYWHLVMSRAYAQLEQWEAAIEAYHQALALFKTAKKPSADSRWFLELTGYTLQLHSRQMDGLEEKCRNLLASAPSPRALVYAHLLMGRFYIAVGQQEEAETHLAYVVQHGNKLLAKGEAELLLAQLQGKPLTGSQLLFAASRAQDRGQFHAAAELYQKAFSLGTFDEQTTSENQFHWATCLLNVGEFAKAIEQLDQIKPFSSLHLQAQQQMLILYEKAIALACLDRLEEATEAQNQAVSIFEKNKLESYRYLLCRSGFFLKIKRGDLDGLEEQIDTLFGHAPTRFDKVAVHMLKANYLLAAGRNQEARPHLEYVAKHAGEHRFRQESQAALDTL